MERNKISRPQRHVLLFSAKKRAASVLQSILSEMELDTVICSDPADLCGKICHDTEAAVLMLNRLSKKAIPKIAESLKMRPECSELPILAAVSRSVGSPATEELVSAFDNALVLDYPFKKPALRSALRAAFRIRQSRRLINDLAKKHRRAEKELKTSRNRLQKKIMERSSDLASEVTRLRRLTGALILSEQKDRRRLAGILHDHLQQLLVSAKYRLASLNHIEDSCARAAIHETEELLGEVIEASRSLTSELSPPIVHESGFQTALEWLVSFMAAQNGLEVRLKIGSEIGPIDENSKAMLFESIRELLVNIVRHAQVKSAEVHIREVEGRLLEIIVSDRGVGFNAETAERNGFGLFRIREQLKLIAGRMGIRSAPGSGSQVTILVPLGGPAPRVSSYPHATNSRLPAKTAMPRMDKPVSGTIRVLIADDHAVMRQGLSSSLSEEPDIVIVGEAADGKTALEKARDLRPDVVLMDLGMPLMNGIEATQKIHSEMPRVRVIGLSMFEEKERANAMFEAGAVAYLSKSCSVHALTSAIRKCTGKSEATA